MFYDHIYTNGSGSHSQHHHHNHNDGDEDAHRDIPPWERPTEPDHPMLVDGGVTDGNTALMFRCMVEEYLFAGHSLDVILQMCRQPNYQGFHAAMHTLGEDRAIAIAVDAAQRVGRHRVREHEVAGTAVGATLTINATTSDSAGSNNSNSGIRSASASNNNNLRTKEGL